MLLSIRVCGTDLLKRRLAEASTAIEVSGQMRWIAPSEKDTDNVALEKRLWDAAEQAVPAPHVAETDFDGGRPQGFLGLIFLRFAEVRFADPRAKLDKAGASSRRGSRVDEPAAYHSESILYLTSEARFDYLLNHLEAENIGSKVNAAMRNAAKCEVRVANSEVQSVRHSQFVIRHSSVPASLDYDAFGGIYERGECRSTKCELRSAVSSTVETRHSQFARSPSSIVRLLTEVIEPYHGRILDPAFHLCANTDPQRDSISTKGPADVLGHATSGMAI